MKLIIFGEIPSAFEWSFMDEVRDNPWASSELRVSKWTPATQVPRCPGTQDPVVQLPNLVSKCPVPSSPVSRVLWCPATQVPRCSDPRANPRTRRFTRERSAHSPAFYLYGGQASMNLCPLSEREGRPERDRERPINELKVTGRRDLAGLAGSKVRGELVRSVERGAVCSSGPAFQRSADAGIDRFATRGTWEEGNYGICCNRGPRPPTPYTLHLSTELTF